jgi:CRISPR-associated endonuclease/helicase Cas3
MAPDLYAKVFGAPPDPPGSALGHDFDGLMLWNASYRQDESVLGAFRIAADPASRQKGSAAVDHWVSAALCHHGRPREKAKRVVSDVFPARQQADVGAFVADVIRMSAGIGEPAALDPPRQESASWLVAGIAVLSDWVGSNQDWFAYRAPEDFGSIDDCWGDAALPCAQDALTRAGVLAADAGAAASASSLLPPGVAASPLQRAAGELVLGSGPQLVVVEDQTGAGKTEAALLLASRFIAGGQGDGLFVALPTMATANAMYMRCRALYGALFADGADPSIVLAHPRRDLVLRGLGLAGSFSEGHYDGETEYAGRACARWIGDDRRKAVLADCGIGTVDQCVLAVLPSRFQSLRLLGLARKVLVLDEVHAHEAYLRQLVCGLLRFHAAMGGSAILLSATLPESQKRQYAEAFAQGAGRRPRGPTIPTP